MRVEGDPGWLAQQARRCRRLAASAIDRRTARTLSLMAEEYEREAATAVPTIVEQAPGEGDERDEQPEPPLLD